MIWKPSDVLSVLDDCAGKFTFPMLDNGYLYLAATRLSVYCSAKDWALVIEVFGYSPRAGNPDIHIHTFASSLHNRDLPENFKDQESYENYLKNNRNNESRFVFPVGETNWNDPNYSESIAENSTKVEVRGQLLDLPNLETYSDQGIHLLEPPRIHVFEMCRYLASVTRENVLATSEERVISLSPEFKQILQLEEWHHPDLVSGELPSNSQTFQQLAHVATSTNPEFYRPTKPSNTHWRNWPDGGTL